MEKWIDLSLSLDEDYLPYPGDDKIIIEKIKSIEFDEFSMHKIITGMHLGTHIDAKNHIFPDEEGVESLDIQRLIGEALVIRPVVKQGVILTDSIAKEYETGYKILLLDFAHGAKVNTVDYYDQPKFQDSILEFLIEQKIEVIGFNLPSPVYEEGELLEMHRDLLGNDIYIVENLCNLDQLKRHVDFVALPLKITGLDGSMIRAVARNK